MSSDAAQRLASAIERLAVPLRMGDGVDEQALDDLRRTLSDAAVRWRTEDVVPKRAAALLVELYPALVGTVDLYEGGDAERIRNICEELLELSLECLDGEH